MNISFKAIPTRPSLKPLLTHGSQAGLPKQVFSETQMRRLDKISIRDENQRYIYSYDAFNFKENRRFEGVAPLKEQELLEGPIEELYTYSDSWLSSFSIDFVREHWEINEFSFKSEPKLKKDLLNWASLHPQREPIQRDPNDGYTTFIQGKSGMENLQFHPFKSSEIIDQLDPELEKQLKLLGYME